MGGIYLKLTPYGLKPVKLSSKKKTYAAYAAIRRKRRPLGALDINTAQRVHIP